MVFSELLEALHNDGLNVTEAQVRWAIRSGKLPRPPLDGSLRFVFSHDHVEQLRDLFSGRHEHGNGDRD